MEAETSSEGFEHISFDARQGRAKLLLFWLTQLSVAQANAEYSKCVQSLSSLHTLCMAYVPEAKRNKVKASIRLAENKVTLHGKNKISTSLLIASLERATEDCLVVYKDQFMTTTARETGEFNPDEFDGSD